MAQVAHGVASARRIEASVLIARAAACVCMWLGAGCTQRPASRPDVILITLDTTRADHLGSYGYGRDVSPHIDRLGRDGVIFERFWSTSPWTLPAHASMLTGKHPTSHGADQSVPQGLTRPDTSTEDYLRSVLPHPLGDEQTTLAELLQEKGYETAVFAGGPYLSQELGLLQGYRHRDSPFPRPAKRRASDLTDQTITWMRAVPRKQPIHVLINYFDPHAPYEPPPGFDDLPGAKVPITVTDLDVTRGTPLLPDQRAAYLDRYDGEIRYMDHHIGRLLEALRHGGRYEDALVIIVGDHGELFGEHGLMEHGHSLYEELLRAPFLVKHPRGRNGGTRSSDLVSSVDLLTLVASEAGLSLPADVQGLPIGRRRHALAECRRGGFFIHRYGPRFDRDLFSIVRWPFKLIVSDRGSTELYRLDDDPQETRMVATDPVETELRSALDTERAGMRPPLRVPHPPHITNEMRERLRALGYVQ